MALVLRLLGGLEVADPAGRPLEVSAKKARALLAYLGAQPSRRHTREQLAALLWGDISADEQARRSLRQALTVLRRALPRGSLEAGRDEIGLGDVPYSVDIVEFHRALEHGDRDALRRAVTLYRGEFLEGFSARADAFDEWVARERSRLREQALGAMERLCRLECDAGQLESAITLAMQIVALEPLRESAHRDLMQLYVAAGARDRALQQYDRCREQLERELSIAPSEETRTLAARIRAAVEVVSQPPAAPQPAVPVMASPSSMLRQVAIVHVTTATHGEPQEVVHRVLTRAGGRVFRTTGDIVAAAYGAGRTRGSIALQAVRAALELRDRMTEAGLVTRIGVAAGLALLEERSEGLVVQGEVVSLASSLPEVGSVVISGSIRADLGVRVEVRERAPVRGGAAWELMALREEETRTVLLGRDFELAQLVASLGPCVTTNRGRSFVVRGEAGIGKSLLVAHFCAEARKLGFEVHTQRVFDFGRGTDADLVHTLARKLMHAPNERDADVALVHAVARGDLAPSDAGFARRMLGSPCVGTSELDAGPEETARREEEILAKLLRARSRQSPQIVWIEDIHWAPPAALRQLAALMSTVADCRALLVMTTRIVGEPEAGPWRHAIKGRAVSTLDLAPLPDEVARALVERLAERRGTPACDVIRIVSRAGGNPLFVEQLVWADATDGVPGSVQALVQARIDTLSESSRTVLQAASVLGQQFDDNALAGVLGTASVDLSELVEHGLLTIGREGATFGHALMRDAVYASLTTERRRALHLAGAAYYAGHNALLQAGHLERADDEAAPLVYLRAADEQRRRGGLVRALELCDRGLGLAAQAADMQRIHQLRGEVLRELGRGPEALDAFETARRHSGDQEERARTWLGTASAYRLLDQHTQALEALDAARACIDPEINPELASSVHCMRGNVLFPSGDAEACLREHERALELGRRARSVLAEAQALNGIADAHYIAGRMHSATVMFERCEALAQREGLGHLERSSRGMRLFIQVFSARLRETAERCIEEADQAERAGALRTVAFLRTGSCMALGYLGDWSRMARYAQAAIDLTRRIGARRFEALSLAYLAIAQFHLDPQRDVSEGLARALELSMASGMPFSGGVIYAAMVDTARNTATARQEVRQGLQTLAAGSLVHGVIYFLQSAIVAMIRARDAEQTRQLSETLASCSSEPCSLVTLFAEIGQAAADMLQHPQEVTHRTRLEQFRARAHDLGLLPLADLLEALLRLPK